MEPPGHSNNKTTNFLCLFSSHRFLAFFRKLNLNFHNKKIKKLFKEKKKGIRREIFYNIEMKSKFFFASPKN